MMWSVIAASIAVGLIANEVAYAQSTGVMGLSPSPNPIVLVDSTGKAVARALNETIMLVTISSGVAAPALIRPIYDSDRRTASGLATWQAGGSVLFTSSDCTGGALHRLRFVLCGRARDHAGTDSGRDHALCGSGWNCEHGGDSLDSLRHRMCAGDGPTKRLVSCLDDR